MGRLGRVSAHEAIRSQRYRQAVQVLEACLSEGILSDEISDLIQFARHEAHREERNALIETSAARAHALINQGSYDQVISLLEPVVAEYDDPALRALGHDRCTGGGGSRGQEVLRIESRTRVSESNALHRFC